MSKFDSFNRDFNKCKNLEDEIQGLIKNKNELIQKGQSNNKIDFMLEGKMDSFRFEISRLDQAVLLTIQNPMQYGVTEREAEKRRDKVEDFKEKLRLIESQIQMAMSGGSLGTLNQSNHSLDNDLESNLLGDDGEYANTRGKDNKQVLEVQKKMLHDQDKHFDALAGIAHNMKADGAMIGEELDYQNNMMDDLNRGMDKTHMKMMRVDGKLKKLISESNQC